LELKKLTGALVVCALALSLLAWTGRTAEAQAPNFGVVDEDKLADSYTKYRDAVAKIDKRAQDLDSQLVGREMLAGADGQRFDTLILKDNRTEAENKELDALVKKGTDLRAELIGLMGTPTRSEAQTKRMTELQNIAKANQDALKRISDQLYENVKKLQEKTDKDYTEQANNVIAQIASEKKLLLVVRKRAVIWNADSIDITDEVLKRLNK
jgi:Skp family chaperone for outer membrane proteins